jgi:hypothetical protein
MLYVYIMVLFDVWNLSIGLYQHGTIPVPSIKLICRSGSRAQPPLEIDL